MKQLLQRYADSSDAMALRERVMFFGAVALVLMTLLQVFLLNPVLSRRPVVDALRSRKTKRRRFRLQIQAWFDRRQDQDELNRERLEPARQMTQLDRQFEQQQLQFVTPEKWWR